MMISQNDGLIIVNRGSENREQKSLHGTTRQMINNMVIGVSKGFSKELEIIGVGYQAQVQGSRLHLQLGFSHDIYFDVPARQNKYHGRTLIVNVIYCPGLGLDSRPQ